MVFNDTNAVFFTAYTFRGLVLCTTKDMINKLVESYKESLSNNDHENEYSKTMKSLMNSILPIKQLYLEKPINNLCFSYTVDLIITSPEEFRENVNKYILSTKPVFYSVLESCTACHYSLKFEKDILTIVLAPNSDTDYEKLMKIIEKCLPKN